MSGGDEQRLAGRRVVTTRDEPGELERLLAEAGADVVHVPLIEIAEPLDRGAALSAALTSLAEFDWLIVTSHHGAARVGTRVALHPGVRLAAVGTRTATELARYAGRAVDVVPERQTAADLVRAMPGPGAANRVLVAQADRAAPTLAEGLAGRGYAVRTVIAYRTRTRTPSTAERERMLAADAVAFASGSAAEAWCEAIGRAAPPVVVAIGPTTAAAAEGCGVAVTDVASEHSVAGLFDAVVAALSG